MHQGFCTLVLFSNPQHTCTARVSVVGSVCCVCVYVCESVKSNLNYGASVHPENTITYSAGNEDYNRTHKPMHQRRSAVTASGVANFHVCVLVYAYWYTRQPDVRYNMLLYLVCVFVCVSMLISTLRATKQVVSDTNSSSITRAQKMIGDFPETAMFSLEKLGVSLTNYFAQPIN